MIDDIKLTKLNRAEGIRYLGYGENMPDDRIMSLIDECEREILDTAVPRYIYRIFNVRSADTEGIEAEGTGLVLRGSSICGQLDGCRMAAFLCATLSYDMDRLIRVTQVKHMVKALIMDAFAGAAVEQLCDKAEQKIKEGFPDKYFTYRFGIGYGDLPIEQLPDFLRLLNAEKTVGVTVTGGNMMVPLKSVACIIGISDNEIKSKKRGCITCNMRDNCSFRARGERCGF